MTLLRPIAFALLLTAPALALAETPLRNDAWAGTAEFGLAVASGNSESQTINGKLALDRDSEVWLYGINASALRAKAQDDLSANRYELGGRLGYLFSERLYGFGALRYGNDDFASYRWQTVLSAGFGYRFVDSDRTRLVGELGPGVRYWQPVDELAGASAAAVPRDAESDAVLRGTAEFTHQLGANTALINTLLVESGSGSTFLQNELSLAVKMSERFALKVGYDVRHTTEVPSGVEKTDRLLTTNLVVGF